MRGMGLRLLRDRVLARQAEGIVAVPVASAASAGADAPGFVANEVYLEVRIRQMWLTNERELWREYQPFGAVVTEFIRQGKRVAIPSLLGAAELGRRFGVTGADDAIEFGNIRVAGPVPYEGDDVSLLLALFRVKTTDWLIRSLTLIEQVASVVGFAGLAAAAPLASTLIDGVESFLDVKEAEFRVGAYCSWSSPSDADSTETTVLAPMHYAILRRPRIGASTRELTALRVKDGRLHRLNDGVLVPYSEHDFILISIDARRFREDYRQLDFYQLWQQAKQRLIDGDLTAARRMWRQASGAIYTDDLTRPQQQVLFTEYERMFADMVERFVARGASSRRDQTIASVLPEEDDDPEMLLRRALA